MADTPRARVGFVSPSATRGAHYDSFLDLVPDDVEVEIEALALFGRSLEELHGTADAHLAKTSALVKARGWDGVALLGAPMQVQNPGFVEQVRAALGIPVTSALEASVAALWALSVRVVLLLTPFDERMNALIMDFLGGMGIEASVPATTLDSIAAAESLGPDDVYALARDAFGSSGGAQAIYFQGARLNPLGALERMEQNLAVPVVASNPAMFWHLLSLLDVRCELNRGGRLLREWPSQA